MDNTELLQQAAKDISKLIRLEQAWRAGQVEIEGEVIVFDQAYKTKLKQKFASIRSDCIDALNAITP